MAKKKVYRALVKLESLAAMSDLNKTEYRVALALIAGAQPDTLGLTSSTESRTLLSLAKKGIVEEVKAAPAPPEPDDDEPDDDAADFDKPPITDPDKIDTSAPDQEWLTKVKPLDMGDGSVEFEEFTIEQIVEMGRDGRFGKFIEVMQADGNEPNVRAAWVKLETEYAKKDGDKIREIVYLYPAIIQAAQHYMFWKETGQIATTDPAVWLNEGHFDLPEYQVLPGEKPGAPGDDEALLERVNAATEALLDTGAEFEEMYPWEKPIQAARRLEARLADVRKLAAMG